MLPITLKLRPTQTLVSFLGLPSSSLVVEHPRLALKLERLMLGNVPTVETACWHVEQKDGLLRELMPGYLRNLRNINLTLVGVVEQKDLLAFKQMVRIHLTCAAPRSGGLGKAGDRRSDD